MRCKKPHFNAEVFMTETNKTIVSYDTETTGLPNWKTPSGGDDQPHVVQIGAVKYNAETECVVDSIDMIIRPDGWVIPEETIAVHGITNEYALKFGIPEQAAIKLLLDFCEYSERVAYNRTFDQRIIRIGLKRFFDEDIQEKWANKEDHHCSMQMARKVIGGKNPKLTEAFKHFTGEEMEGAHNALADAKGSATVYFAALKKLNVF
jgi:DNA polymerase-3 subunit epsilon